MRIVIALGGNALLQRGEAPGIAPQRAHATVAAAAIARLARLAGPDGIRPLHQLLITHGNGPQVGLLAVQAVAAADAAGQAVEPLDALGAQTQGELGYLLEQALANALPQRHIATLFTRTEVSAADPAFAHPSKPIGLVYDAAEAARVRLARGWVMAADGTAWRRVVASPAPLRVLNVEAIRTLLDQGFLVVAAGGGGVPVRRRDALAADGAFEGVEAVIDKDASSAWLAMALQADSLLIATDVPALYADWGLPTQRPVLRSTPAALAATVWAAGSMGPKVRAACDYVRATGRPAVIGALGDIDALLAGTAGTQIHPDRPA